MTDEDVSSLGSPIADIHAGDREAVLTAISEQAALLHGQDIPTMTCPCGAHGDIDMMFRCFYCDIFFCPGCAEDHFEEVGDDGPALWGAIDDVQAEFEAIYDRLDALEQGTAAAEPDDRRRGWGQ